MAPYRFDGGSGEGDFVTSASQPQSIGGVLDSGFKLFTASIKQVVPITYIAALIGGIWGWVYQTVFFNQLMSGEGTAMPGIAMFLSVVIVFIVNAMLMAAAIYRISQVDDDQTIGFGDALSAGAQRMPAVLGAWILYILAIMVGSLLLIIPGIWLSISLAFCFFAAVIDRKGPIESLKYSHGLVRGNWWRTAAVLTIVLIISMVFYFAIGFVSGLFLIADDSNMLQPNLIGDVIVSPVLISVVSAMVYCLAYVVYEDLKLRAEGGDLAERIESLDSA